MGLGWGHLQTRGSSEAEWLGALWCSHTPIHGTLLGPLVLSFMGLGATWPFMGLGVHGWGKE